MSETSDAIIAQLEAGHELVAVGGFTIDVAAARDKLEDYRVADPHTFVLLLVEAAHLFADCRAIEFEITATRTKVSLREVVLDEHERETILDAADASANGLEPRAAARVRARQLFALALITARQLPDTTLELGSNPTRLTVRGPRTMRAPGQRASTTELPLRLGKRSPLKPGDRFHVRVDPDDPSRVTPASGG